MTPGFVEGMPEKIYHADPCPTPSLSSGLVKMMDTTSMQKVRLAHPRLNPPPPGATDDDPKFDLGTAAHALFLEGADEKVVEVCADSWRTKDAKDRRAAIYAAGLTPLLTHQLDAARKMAAAAHTFIAESGLTEKWAEGQSELSGFWKEGDLWCRMRVDRMLPKVLVDLKTTGDASPEGFSRHIVKMGYHIQDAFYRRGAAALGMPDKPFLFLAIEDEFPHACAWHACDGKLKAIGDAVVDKAIWRFHECLRTGVWPGYGTEIHHASAPGWLAYKFEGGEA